MRDSAVHLCTIARRGRLLHDDGSDDKRMLSTAKRAMLMDELLRYQILETTSGENSQSNARCCCWGLGLLFSGQEKNSLVFQGLSTSSFHRGGKVYLQQHLPKKDAQYGFHSLVSILAAGDMSERYGRCR